MIIWKDSRCFKMLSCVSTMDQENYYDHRDLSHFAHDVNLSNKHATVCKKIFAFELSLFLKSAMSFILSHNFDLWVFESFYARF